MANLKNIVQSESIRGNEADSGASLKFIILGVTRVANLKIIIQSESIRGNEDVYEFEIYYLRVTRTVIIKQSHSREFYAPSRAYFLQLQHTIYLEIGKIRQRRRCKEMSEAERK